MNCGSNSNLTIPKPISATRGGSIRSKWWEDLETEYRDKIDLTFKEVFFEYG